MRAARPQSGFGAFWKPEEDDELRREIERGSSAAGAALALGKTRSAVLGRALRLGIGFRSDKRHRTRKKGAPSRVTFARSGLDLESVQRSVQITFPSSPAIAPLFMAVSLPRLRFLEGA